jgi:hypothetical protein
MKIDCGFSENNAWLIIPIILDIVHCVPYIWYTHALGFRRKGYIVIYILD